MRPAKLSFGPRWSLGDRHGEVYGMYSWFVAAFQDAAQRLATARPAPQPAASLQLSPSSRDNRAEA